MTLSITLVIIIACVALSVSCFENPSLKYKLIFNPYQVQTQNKWYKVISHAFIHADYMHLAVNMFVLYMFGEQVEASFVEYFGTIGYAYFVCLYLGGILFSTLPAFIRHNNSHHYNSLGASGAVSAVVFAYIIISPTSKLMFILLPIPLPAIIFGILYLALEVYMDKRNSTNVAHDAHFFGALFGIAFTLLIDFSFFSSNFIQQIKTLF